MGRFFVLFHNCLYISGLILLSLVIFHQRQTRESVNIQRFKNQYAKLVFYNDQFPGGRAADRTPGFNGHVASVGERCDDYLPVQLVMTAEMPKLMEVTGPRVP